MPSASRDSAASGSLADRYLDQRRQTRAFFDMLDEIGAYFERPIPLRNPFVFYEGHLPAFAVNTLIKRGLSRPGLHEAYEVLFERGIDPASPGDVSPEAPSWPSRRQVLAYASDVDDLIVETLLEVERRGSDTPASPEGEAALTILEHEPMHQETLGYMAHRLSPDRKRAFRPGPIATAAEEPSPRVVPIPGGLATLGSRDRSSRFGWDNEFPEQIVDVPGFSIDAYDITNRAYLEFVLDGGYRRSELWPEGLPLSVAGEPVRHPAFWERDGDGRFFWRGMFELVPLPMSWPVWVSGREADAFARWSGKRLPTEAELHRAAYGTPWGAEQSHPWGEEAPDETRGCFGFESWDPVPVGSRPRGASAFGVEDLVGNGWEWTSTPFSGFDGFVPMASYPNYSADFFDGQHWVLKGASPATSKCLLRRSFRNWFRPSYPYVYASFRCVSIER